MLEKKELLILHLERQLFVWNKPAGVETQDEAALQTLRDEINRLEGRSGTPFIQPIHRLDQPTSGIVVFARSSKSLSRLQASLRDRKTEKYYLAWVEGEVKGEKRFVDKIRHASHHAKLDEEGKTSSLSFEVLRVEKKRSLLLIHLETGRYHQIRLQLASRGYPVIGDLKYGGKRGLEEGILLHHFSFKIPHPLQEAQKEEKMLHFLAPPPPSFGPLSGLLKERFPES